MELQTRTDADLVAAFLAAGGSVRRIPDSATVNRPSSLPKPDRDKYVKHRRGRTSRGPFMYFAIERIYAIEALIEARAPIEDIAKAAGMAAYEERAALVEKLENNGIAFPDYLRAGYIGDLDQVNQRLRGSGSRRRDKSGRPIGRSRTLTIEQRRALEFVRNDVSVARAARQIEVSDRTLYNIVNYYFGEVATLRRISTKSAMLAQIDARDAEAHAARADKRAA